MSSFVQSSFRGTYPSADHAVFADENRAHGRACVFDDSKRTPAAAAKKSTKSDRKADKTSATAN